MVDTVHIAVAMKPVERGFAKNAVEHGVAGLNIDRCRVETDDKIWQSTVPSYQDDRTFIHSSTPGIKREQHEKGRWPANVILDGSEVIVEQFPHGHARGNIGKSKGGGGLYGHDKCLNDFGAGDAGSAARFFKECKDES